jgi:uncharacterized protein YegL
LLLTLVIGPVTANLVPTYTADYDQALEKVTITFNVDGGPQGAKISDYPVDCVILLDLSASMRDQYQDKTKLDWMKNTSKDFVKALYSYNTRLGVITYSSSVSEIQPLTSNFEDVMNNINAISTYGESTDYENAFQTGINSLKLRNRESIPVIVMVTDGGEIKSTDTLSMIIEDAKKAGITINIIGIGDRSRINDIMLTEKVTQPTGGTYQYSSFEGLADAMVKSLKTDQVLSAANVHITLYQTDDAILNPQSIDALVSPGLILNRITYLDYISPKITPTDKIKFTYDVFSAKDGKITPSKVTITFTNERGIKETIEKNIETTIHKSKPLDPTVFIALDIIFIIVIAILGISYKSQSQKINQTSKDIMGTLFRNRSNKVDVIEQDIKNKLILLGYKEEKSGQVGKK